jgi:hypothetical protein
MAFLLSRIGLVRPRSEMIKIKSNQNGLPYPNAKRTSSIILAVLPNRFNEMLSAGSPRASEFFTFGVEIE